MPGLKIRCDPLPPKTNQPGLPRSLLYSGSRFQGQQKSKGNSYDVEVVLQHVDEENAFLCGYLKIIGLTEEYPLLTTYFDGEIICDKHPFLTRKWEADEEVDRKHWVRVYHKYSAYHHHHYNHHHYYHHQPITIHHHHYNIGYHTEKKLICMFSSRENSFLFINLQNILTAIVSTFRN
ncbi:Hypothetical predicted protein [Paramuricea clavata]|uniref:Uncharacterized protein n=1 Tax=Paramuricea clavata TaxID=317549 RepID=A0A7D9EL23_PARCT|nr:Hypothetical predicted protein [Paramuricea clavata]